MKIWFWTCIILIPCFGMMTLIMGIMKEKFAKYIAGFNSFSEAEQELYDREYLVRDMRNSVILWTTIMFIGALGSCFISDYAGMIAFFIWLILFFKDVHLDNRKAFEKYLKK